MTNCRKSVVVAAVALLAIFAVSPAALAAPKLPPSNTIVWTGQGVTCDAFGDCVINLELCGVANGADCDQPYLLWVLSGATNITSATITISGCGTAAGGCGGGGDGSYAMTKVGGTYKHISAYCPGLDAGTLQASVTYAGTATNPQFVISHGCKPSGSLNLWCSPGYWRFATDAAWALTGYSRTDLYNSTTCGQSNPVVGNPTLQDVLNSPQTYGGAAFNCIGKLLTNTLCGADQLNPDCPGIQAVCPDNCPYDHFGNRKPDAPPECN